MGKCLGRSKDPADVVQPGQPLQREPIAGRGNRLVPPNQVQRRMTTRLWSTLEDQVPVEEENVEDRVAALRLQEFLKKHQNNMVLGLLTQGPEVFSEFEHRIEQLFCITTPKGDIVHRRSDSRAGWVKRWVTTAFLLEFLERNWTHVNFSPFMTLEDVESRLSYESHAIVVRLSSTIPGFITVSCNAKETGLPIHVRYQVRADQSIRGEQDVTYASFFEFINSFDQQVAPAYAMPEGARPRHSVPQEPAPATEDPRRHQDSNPIQRLGADGSHVALYARTSDIKTWVKETEQVEGAGPQGEDVNSTLFLHQEIHGGPAGKI